MTRPTDNRATESASDTELGRRERPPALRPEGVDDDAFVRVFRVAPEHAGMRIDVFLSSQLRNTSRTRAKVIAEKGVYTLDGRKLRSNDRVRAEEHLAVWRAPIDEIDQPQAVPILHEDDHLLVVDKPPMLAVHPTARHHHATVIKLLQNERPEQYLSLVHRLDRETSGILLVAKSKTADRAFKTMLEDKSLAEAHRVHVRPRPALPIEKTYLAITWGTPRSGLIDLPLEPDRVNPLRVKMIVARPGTGLEASTEVTVLDRTERYALVACRLLTGRQHQIRVHLSAVGCPVVGDKLYGPDERMLARSADRELTAEDLVRLELPRQALHAHRYLLPHALSGTMLDLVSHLPPDLSEFWAAKAGRTHRDTLPGQELPAPLAGGSD